jgi:putative addiction module killer protein
MKVVPREILVCQDDEGREPFRDWLDCLDTTTEAIVLSRIDRVEEGNLGDFKSLGEGISELRIDFGPGYRVYFGQIGNEVHLIRGGSKSNQQRDIEAAKKFWRAHAQ